MDKDGLSSLHSCVSRVGNRLHRSLLGHNMDIQYILTLITDSDNSSPCAVRITINGNRVALTLQDPDRTIELCFDELDTMLRKAKA